MSFKYYCICAKHFLTDLKVDQEREVELLKCQLREAERKLEETRKCKNDIENQANDYEASNDWHPEEKNHLTDKPNEKSKDII